MDSSPRKSELEVNKSQEVTDVDNYRVMPTET